MHGNIEWKLTWYQTALCINFSFSNLHSHQFTASHKMRYFTSTFESVFRNYFKVVVRVQLTLMTKWFIVISATLARPVLSCMPQCVPETPEYAKPRFSGTYQKKLRKERWACRHPCDVNSVTLTTVWKAHLTAKETGNLKRFGIIQFERSTGATLFRANLLSF